MLKANFITAQEAAEKIQDGSTLCTIGMTLVSASESILKAIEKRFETVGHPADITLVHSCGQSDMEFSIWRTKGLSRELLDPIGGCNRDGWR